MKACPLPFRKGRKESGEKTQLLQNFGTPVAKPTGHSGHGLPSPSGAQEKALMMMRILNLPALLVM